MNQQEFENRTQGMSEHQKEVLKKISDRHNKMLRVEELKKSAFDNTVGKSINPESVEKMKDALQAFYDYAFTSPESVNIPNNLKWKLKEALTAAKLEG
jgi:hemerythrin-like domain-containing protein